jgi:hypothetical protein
MHQNPGDKYGKHAAAVSQNCVNLLQIKLKTCKRRLGKLRRDVKERTMIFTFAFTILELLKQPTTCQLTSCRCLIFLAQCPSISPFMSRQTTSMSGLVIFKTPPNLTHHARDTPRQQDSDGIATALKSVSAILQ